MPDISKIILPSGNEYNIKDSLAREQIAALTGASIVRFIGVSTTAITDGGNEKPTINNALHNPTSGLLIFYGTAEFVYGNDNKWHGLGNLDNFGNLAYKDDASATYTPAGTVSQPTFSGSSLTSTGTFTPEGSIAAPTISVATAGTTSTIHNPTKETVAKTVVAAEPGATAPSNSITYYSVANETLSLYQLGYTTGDSITTSDVVVKTGDAAYTATAPVFTGTQGNVNVVGTPLGTVSQPTFTGTQATIVVS